MAKWGSGRIWGGEIVYDETNTGGSFNAGNTVKTDGSATFGIDDTDTDLQAAYQTAVPSSATNRPKYKLQASDASANAIWGYIFDIAKATNAYTLDIYDDTLATNQNFNGDQATFDETDTPVTYDICEITLWGQLPSGTPWVPYVAGQDPPDGFPTPDALRIEIIPR